MATDIGKKMDAISLADSASQEGDNDSGVDESTQAKSIPVNRVRRSLSTSSTKPQKLPMNKIKVGCAPSPNLSSARSKIGSLDNASHKPGGGNVRIPIQKISIEAKPRVAAHNANYVRSGGDKKIQTLRLQWDAKPKVGSLENAVHKPGGGSVRIENRKIDFKEKAKSKVGSTVNIKHTPGGGNVKIFDDKEYLRQRKDSGISKASSDGAASGTQSPECN